jgi:hypothetical protein
LAVAATGAIARTATNVRNGGCEANARVHGELQTAGLIGGADNDSVYLTSLREALLRANVGAAGETLLAKP